MIPISWSLALGLLFLISDGPAAGAPETVALLYRIDGQAEKAMPGGSLAEQGAGVVVESVKPVSTGERAGLREGDVILSWSCAAAPPSFPEASGGGLRSPYDLLPLEIEEVPRRPVTLRGRRGKQDLAWTITAGDWGIRTRPYLPAGLASQYEEGKAFSDSGDFVAAERSWRAAARSAADAGDGRLAAWLLHRLAGVLADEGKWSEADAAFEEALEALKRESQIPAAAQLLRDWGGTFLRRGAWDAATDRFQQALACDRTSSPRSLAAAWTHSRLAITATERGDYAAADDHFRQALALREELAPGTAEVTGSLNNLGILARRRGDLAAAEEFLRRGEELQRRLAPGGTDHALFFQNLGNLAQDRGDLEQAAGYHRQALAIFEKTAPGGDGVADCLHNLAIVAMKRGELSAADDSLRRSLVLRQRRAPEDLEISKTLMGLGVVATRRGDLEEAEVHYRRALEIQQRISPEGREAAQSLGSLGIVAAQRRDFAAARAYLRRALAIMERLLPESLEVAEGLARLGRLEIDSDGKPEAAEEYLRAALRIYQDKAPESLGTSDVLRDLGQVAARSGRLTEALALHRRSLEIRRKLAPETTSEAEALHILGRAERRAGRHAEGIRRLCIAIDILDRQRSKLGGTPESRSAFEASVSDYYSACLEGLVELGRADEAFHALERGRARSFLQLLGERDLRLSGLPPEIAGERRRLNAEYDRVQAQLARLNAGRDGSEIERLSGVLRDLRTRQEEIVARVRREAPRPAALHDPQPLDLKGARAALDPGTVLLAYAVGPERSWLFVVDPSSAGPGLAVFPVAAGEQVLREDVERFRRLLKSPRSDRTVLQAQARRLYGLLVRPAEKHITGAQRLLLSLDGPLHTLPFAALMRGESYLAEWKPLHSVLSATVYAEVKRSRPARREPGEEGLAAFGDPVYPLSGSDPPADPDVREALRRGLVLKTLPASRAEVAGIVALFPRAQAFLGPEATEENAKAVGPRSRLVHFACHGLLDERFPLNSALALTLPGQPVDGQENGLLQAWEIFEGARFDADLVTLSACDTALGKEMGGEGLVGLTRAFQYAGARSVLASLWSVADVSTGDLMHRFYGHLRDGKTKDEALQAAQTELIRSKRKRLSHPFHWAAFQLVGDWR